MARLNTRDVASAKSDSDEGTPLEVRSAVHRELLEALAELRTDKLQRYPNLIPVVDKMMAENSRPHQHRPRNQRCYPGLRWHRHLCLR